jgi:hypothetical protein
MPARPRRHPRSGLALLVGALGVAVGAVAADRAPADPGEFSYAALPAEGTLEARIDAATPVFEFKTGRSAFLSFRLPAGDKPYFVEVRSLLSGGTAAARGRVFYPVAALLDDDFMVSRQTDLDALRFDLPVFEDASAPAYRLAIGVDPTQGKERYLVIFTPAALLSRRAAVDATTPEAAAKAAREAYPGAAPDGVVRVTVHADGIAR